MLWRQTSLYEGLVISLRRRGVLPPDQGTPILINPHYPFFNLINNKNLISFISPDPRLGQGTAVLQRPEYQDCQEVIQVEDAR